MREQRLTRDRAAAHEALFPKLEKLTRQAEAIALRRPEAPVPAETRAAAEALLFDARKMLGQQIRAAHPGRRKPGRDFPAASDTFAGLSTQLGQALAGLDAFEAAHTSWNVDLKCVAWQLGGDDTMPVKRLRPELLRAPEADRHDRTSEHIRQKITARFRERYEEGYEDGLKAARDPANHPYPTDEEKGMLAYRNAFALLAGTLVVLSPLVWLMRLPPKTAKVDPEQMAAH